MTNALKVQKLAITAFIMVVMAFVFCNLFTVQAHAAGLLDETIDTAHEFSRYPIDNYQLDFYVDSSWDWLPWNWLDGIGKTAQYAIYLFTNFLWTLNLYISNAVGYLIQQAYDLDFISSAASEIGKNIQLIAGVSASGLDRTGLFPGMMAIVTLLVGVYCTYVGLVKRETTKAFHAALNFVVVFVVSVGLIAYAPSAITGVNEFSSDISNGIVDVSAKILAPDAAGENTGVSAIRDCLFGIQVKQPWLIMQFGDSDVENIGEERVNSLLGTSPDEKLFDAVKPNMDSFVTQMVDYFVEKGHKKIGFIGGSDRNIDTGMPSMDVREWSFRQSTAYYKCLNEEYILISDKFTVDDGYRMGKELLKKESLPTALCIASDTLAVGVLQALNEGGIQVPEQIALFSINDVNIAKYLSPPLTTIHIDIPCICETALDLLRTRVLSGGRVTKLVFVNGIPVFRKSC